MAHELRRRPSVAAAFAGGSLTYCKVRAITRIIDADAETDEWLIRVGHAGTVADLDRVVRRWQSLREQERGVDDYLARFERRSVTASRTYDGMMVLQTVMPIEEGEEVLGRLDSQVADEPVDDGSCEPPFSASVGPTPWSRWCGALVRAQSATP